MLMKTIEPTALEVADALNAMKHKGKSFPLRDKIIDDYAIRFATKFLEAWQAQQSQEPVAWACFAENGNIRIWKSAPPDDVVLVKENGIELIPLFLAPPPAIPDHMCLVPKEPSEAIRNALRTGSRKDYPSDELCNIRWAAAIAQGGK